MIMRDELVAYLDERLAIRAIPLDKSSNGLQVEGRAEVRRVVGAVDGSLQSYRQAAARQADLLFVHHGEFWGEGVRAVTGRVARRLGTLLRAEVSLYAAHLPLDAHPELGHNAVIAQRLALVETQPFAPYAGVMIGIAGRLPEPLPMAALVARIDAALATHASVCGPVAGPVRRLGIVSGGGAAAIAECQRLGLDALLTGEVGHTDFHPIHELGIPVIAAGHYRTEAPGVEAVLAELTQRFGLACEFLDLPTGL
jgi:dinuclear metal center YbgI/SA1388 family protein